MIALPYDNALHEGYLVYSGGRMVDTGFDLETAALISLLTHARALPSDALPVGTNRRGWWADDLDDTGDQTGSMLWLLESAVATPENARKAELYAQEALRWLIDAGHVRSIDTEYELHTDACWLGITFTLLNGDTQTLSPFKAF